MSVPLRLSLEPARPARVPRTRRAGTAGAGFRLVLDDQVPIDQDDPLLAAYGAWVVSLTDAHRHLDALQDAAFAPGHELTLEPAPSECDRNVVRVLDAAGVRPAGHVAREHAARVAAALEHGLALRAISLCERRDLLSGERTGLRVLIAAPAFVDVVLPASPAPQVERLPAPQRVILAVERDGSLRWWDARSELGPRDLGELPLSRDLVDDLLDLQQRWHDTEEAASDLGEPVFPWERQNLEARGRTLWRRARTELCGRYLVGWKPPDAEQPVYADEPAPATADDDIPF